MTLKTPSKEMTSKYLRLKNDSVFHRGFIIEESIVMEQVMDSIFSNYFCKEDKISEINEIVFNNEYISLGAKENILTAILEKFPDLKRNNSNLIQDIAFIRKKRNNLAHLKLSATDEDLNNYNGKDIPYNKWVNGVYKKYFLTEEEAKKTVDLITTTINKLIELEGIVIKNRQTLLESKAPS